MDSSFKGPPVDAIYGSLVAWVVLGSHPGIVGTGRCRHVIGGQEMPVPHGLAIVRDDHGNTGGCFLLYCDPAWREMTDTWHRSVDDAFRQASFEYDGLEGHWVFVEQA